MTSQVRRGHHASVTGPGQPECRNCRHAIYAREDCRTAARRSREPEGAATRHGYPPQEGAVDHVVAEWDIRRGGCEVREDGERDGPASEPRRSLFQRASQASVVSDIRPVRLADQGRSRMGDEHDSALSYYETGNEFMCQADWASATRAFRAAIQFDPNLAQAYAGLGAALGNQGLWTLSAEAHTRALALAPDDVDTLYNLGVAYGELGRPVEAESYFRRVLSARPGDEETLLRLGTELGEQERFADALEKFHEASRANPPTAFTALASAYAGAAMMKLGRTSEARAALEHARALEPTFFEQRPEFVQLWVELGGD